MLSGLLLFYIRVRKYVIIKANIGICVNTNFYLILINIVNMQNLKMKPEHLNI